MVIFPMRKTSSSQVGRLPFRHPSSEDQHTLGSWVLFRRLNAVNSGRARRIFTCNSVLEINLGVPQEIRSITF
jgi:hypothetical protein